MANVEAQVKQLSERIEQHLNSLGRQRVLVGIPEDKATRSDPKVNNAYLGVIHENGSPARNIPARPFLHPGVQKARPKVVKILEKACADAVKNPNFNPQKALGDAGTIARDSVKDMFRNNNWPPNSPTTIYLKGSDRPLIDTGQLRDSIHYTIVDESEVT